MAGKIVSQLDADGFFVCTVEADEDPMNPGSYLLPGGCVDVPCPTAIKPEKRYRLDLNRDWEAVDIVIKDPQPVAASPAYESSSEELRSEAYRSESDPLFFKAQRGEATMADWLAKVEEIKARYPG